MINDDYLARMDHNPHQIKTAVMIGHDRYMHQYGTVKQPCIRLKALLSFVVNLGKHNMILDIVFLENCTFTRNNGKKTV